MPKLLNSLLASFQPFRLNKLASLKLFSSTSGSHPAAAPLLYHVDSAGVALTVHNYYCIVVMRHDGERKLAVLAILMLHEC
eukprot:19332-Heterococcus_DN1.PRE.1